MSDLAKQLAGKFIVLDGPDGSGKSTQLALLRDHLAGMGAEVEAVHDPGGTEVGEKIRAILLDKENGRMGPTCEMLLFMASRAQLIEERVRPALENGKVVLCDRFISATVAYQGASRIDHKTVIELGETATGSLWPDLTIILDLPAETGLERIRQNTGAAPAPLDRMESKEIEFHQSVRRIFKELADYYPRPVVCVNAAEAPDDVFQVILSKLEKAFA